MTGSKSSQSWDVKPEYADIFEIGQKVDLILLEDGSPRTYPSQVQDIDETRIMVSSPMYKGMIVRAAVGSEITLSLFMNGARYMGSGKVTAQLASPLPMVKVVRPQDVRRVQFRSNFRMDVELPECTLHVQPSPDASVRYELEANVVNLSAGGARFKLKREVPISTVAPTVRYFLDLPLDFEDPLGDWRRRANAEENGEDREPPEIVSIPCKMISVDEATEAKETIYNGRCSFDVASMHAQDRISRFINECQMAVRRRRLA